MVGVGRSRNSPGWDGIIYLIHPGPIRRMAVIAEEHVIHMIRTRHCECSLTNQYLPKFDSLTDTMQYAKTGFRTQPEGVKNN